MAANNTDLADVNEIHTAFVLNDNKYPDKASEAQVDKKVKLMTLDQVFVQCGRAESMAKEFLKWARANGYKGSIKSVHWTARPGFSFKAIVGYDVDQKKNPSDVLVEFSDKKFLGLSAKSTKGKGDIGFKNPGMGTVEKDLQIQLKPILKTVEDKFVEENDLPKSASQRKGTIRADEKLKAKADEEGGKVLNSLRDAMLKRVNQLTEKQRKDYIINSWIDAGSAIMPYYVKVTGRGNKAPFSSSVEDPLDNAKIRALNTARVTFEPVGNDSIGVKAGEKKLLKMRFKFESQKLASGIKMSGDPW